MHCVLSIQQSAMIMQWWNNVIRLVLNSSWYRDLYQSGKIVKKLFYPNLPEGCTLRLCQACTFSQISWMWWAKTRSNRGLKLSGIFLIWILQFAVFVDLTLCCAAAAWYLVGSSVYLTISFESALVKWWRGRRSNLVSVFVPWTRII